jgi:hypothetical protein
MPPKLPKLPNPLGLPDPLGITDHPDKKFELKLSWGRGYSGKMGNKCWVAKIKGIDEEYKFDRTFLDADRVEKEHFGRQRTIINFYYNLEDGLYEQSEKGEKILFIVWDNEKWKDIEEERAMKIAKLLDEGKGFEESRLATK